MPKYRKRATEKGAKSTSVRIKHKIGGRKSGRGASQLSIVDLTGSLEKCRKRDRFTIIRELNRRGVLIFEVI